jgi:predicted NBD/HSP70 family sugar kinase
VRSRSGINMSDVKISNRALILRQIKNYPKPRKDIAEKIHLTPAAVTILVNELIEQGCIHESGEVSEPSRVGRKKVFIELNKEYKYAFGINIEGRHMNVCLGNLKAEVIDCTDLRIKNMKAEEVLDLAVQTIGQLMKKNGLDESRILGVGVGIVGKVDSEHGISKLAYGLWDTEINIEQFISSRVDVPVVVENNVRALALAEMELTLHRNIRNMVFMKLGPGIGSAIILDNDIYKGSFNNSGELGHMVTNINGKKCRCGQVGCLETVASIAALIDDIREDFSSELYPHLFELVQGDVENITEELLIQTYFESELKVVEKIDRLICFLSVGIINSIKFYDPHKIVLYSKMFKDTRFMELLITEILRHDSIEDLDDLEDRIEISRLSSQKGVGGLVLVLNELFYRTGAIE